MHGKVPQGQSDGYQARCLEKSSCILVRNLSREERGVHQVYRLILRGGQQAGVEAQARPRPKPWKLCQTF